VGPQSLSSILQRSPAICVATIGPFAQSLSLASRVAHTILSVHQFGMGVGRRTRRTQIDTLSTSGQPIRRVVEDMLSNKLTRSSCRGGSAGSPEVQYTFNTNCFRTKLTLYTFHTTHNDQKKQSNPYAPCNVDPFSFSVLTLCQSIVECLPSSCPYNIAHTSEQPYINQNPEAHLGHC
jgi:hypothetical protein